MDSLQKAAEAMFIADGNWGNLWPSLKDEVRDSYLIKAQAAFNVFESETLGKLEGLIRNENIESVELHVSRSKIILDISYDQGGVEKVSGLTLLDILQKVTNETAK